MNKETENEAKYRAAIESVILNISNHANNHVPYGGVLTLAGIRHILEKALEPPFVPKPGVVYAFWDDLENTVGYYSSDDPVYAVFKDIVAGKYRDATHSTWDYCRPLTDEELDK